MGRLSSYRLPWDGESYDAWLRALHGVAGVYVMRERGGGRTLYVGEAHNERGGLYDAITRHFQTWRGRTAGVRLDRDKVEVAVERTTIGRAIERQDELIIELLPEHNTQGKPGKRQREVEFKASIRKATRLTRDVKPRRSLFDAWF